MKMLNLLLGFVLVACVGNAVDRRLDEKLARQSEIRSPLELEAKASTLLEATPGLTSEQKEALRSLRASVQEKLRANNSNALKLSAILVEDLLDPGNHAAEIESLKARLRQLARERIELTFDAVNQANDALGRNALLREAIDLQMIDDRINF